MNVRSRASGASALWRQIRDGSTSAREVAQECILQVNACESDLPLFRYYVDCKEAFRASLLQNIECDREIRPSDLPRTLSSQRGVQQEMDNVLNDIDVLITASATGEAQLADVTGGPVMSTMWSLSGTPALSVPIFEGPCGIPVHLQMIADRVRGANVLGFDALERSFVGALVRSKFQSVH